LVSAYFIKERGLSVQEAIDFVKSKRPSMHLDDVQIEALSAFAQQLTTNN
jgi:DNA-binding protein